MARTSQGNTIANASDDALLCSSKSGYGYCYSFIRYAQLVSSPALIMCFFLYLIIIENVPCRPFSNTRLFLFTSSLPPFHRFDLPPLLPRQRLQRPIFIRYPFVLFLFNSFFVSPFFLRLGGPKLVFELWKFRDAKKRAVTEGAGIAYCRDAPRFRNARTHRAINLSAVETPSFLFYYSVARVSPTETWARHERLQSCFRRLKRSVVFRNLAP